MKKTNKYDFFRIIDKFMIIDKHMCGSNVNKFIFQDMNLQSFILINHTFNK